jgi:hypothetical protein
MIRQYYNAKGMQKFSPYKCNKLLVPYAYNYSNKDDEEDLGLEVTHNITL